VKVGGKKLLRQVMPTRSYLSQTELPVTIGLGAAAKPDEVEIVWPGGKRQKVEQVKVDGVTIVTETQ
jgi:hypothetical protein